MRNCKLEEKKHKIYKFNKITKSLERRYNNTAQFNAHWSSYICFAEAIKNQNFCKKIIRIYFNKLVEKDDYDKRDKRELIKQLTMLSVENKNGVEEGVF